MRETKLPPSARCDMPDVREMSGSLGVVDFSGKVDLGRFERVIGRESDGQKEYTSRIRTITLFISPLSHQSLTKWRDEIERRNERDP